MTQGVNSNSGSRLREILKQTICLHCVLTHIQSRLIIDKHILSGSNKDAQVILTIRNDLFYEPGTDDIATVDETENTPAFTRLTLEEIDHK